MGTMKLSKQIQELGSKKNVAIYANALSSCAAVGCGKFIHAHTLRNELWHDTFIGNILIGMYGRCGSIRDALFVFTKMPKRDVVSWNSMISRCSPWVLKKAPELLTQMQHDGVVPNKVTYCNIFSACNNVESLKYGKCVHAHLMSNSLSQDVSPNSSALDMYAKCGSLEEASYLFDRMFTRNVISWTTMISAYIGNGNVHASLKLLEQLQECGLKADKVTYICCIAACGKAGALGWAKSIHSQIINRMLTVDIPLGNSLISMYTRCKNIKSSCEVFDRMPIRDQTSWSSVISGYTQDGCDNEALSIFKELQLQGLDQEKHTWASILSSCTNLGALGLGKFIHARVVQSSITLELFIGNAIVGMYVKCGSIGDACQSFDLMESHDLISWSALIAAYMENSFCKVAFELFEKVKCYGLDPDSTMYIKIFSACGNARSLGWGKLLHSRFLIVDLGFDIFVENSLLNMYFKCGSIDDSCNVFNSLPEQSLVLWTTLISGFAENGCAAEALKVFFHMKNSGFSPDGVNYVTVLSACAYIQSLALAKYVGGHLLKDELKSNLFVQNSLILAYIKCGSMLDAYVIFERVAQQDIVSWSALLQGYSQHGSNSIALNVFELIHSHGLHMDKVMCVTFIRACTVLPSLERGKWGHAHIFKAGFHYNVSVANALITMYAKCGKMEDACFVFEEMATQNELLWSALILGYVQNGNGIKALELFRVMEQFQIDASKATIIAILIVCGNVGAFEWGKQMHSYLKEASLDDEIHVRNMLISMYSKCGSMANAREVFDEMSRHDVISWSSLIAGYAQHGDASEAIKLFQRMQQQGIWPDEVAIISVLTACTYVGSLDIGHYYFISINNIYGVTSAPEHLNCVIDLLGRAGHLHEARDLIDAMVFEDKCVVWVSFLANCKIFDDMGHAEHAAKELLKLDAANLTAVILLSNIYAAAGRWNDKRNVRRLVEEYSGMRR